MAETKIQIPTTLGLTELKHSVLKAKKGHQPYYTEEYAIQARKVLDALHETKQPILVSAGDTSLFTLRLKYYNGVAYLLDHLDESGHYKTVYDFTTCKTTRQGLYFSIRKVAKSKASLAEFTIMAPSWREELQEFLLKASPDDQFFKEKLTLSSDDLSWINTQLTGLVKRVDGEEVPLFFGEINEHKILLIRDND